MGWSKAPVNGKRFQIDEIVDVKPVDDDDKMIQDARIVAVSQLDRYKACLRCKARVEPSTDDVGRCSKPDCRMLQRLEFCTAHLCGKLSLMANSKLVSLSVHGKLLQQLVEVTDAAEVSEEALLSVPILKTVTYNDKNIMTSFTK